MLKDLNLLDDGEVVVVGRHAQHEAVLHVEGNLARIAVLPDQRMQRVRVGHPPNQPYAVAQEYLNNPNTDKPQY